MSRIGKKPVAIPGGVTANIENGTLSVKGPKGTLTMGLSDLVDTVRVRHISGGWSVLGLKSYQQGRDVFEGTERHVIWLDEEPPADVYGECLIRTATVNGLVLLTFTPLEGISEVVKSFLPQDQLKRQPAA